MKRGARVRTPVERWDELPSLRQGFVLVALSGLAERHRHSPLTAIDSRLRHVARDIETAIDALDFSRRVHRNKPRPTAHKGKRR